MTREEAIEYLKRADTTVGKKIKTRTAEALEMAIRALKNEQTDGDLISRKAVLELCNSLSYEDDENEYELGYDSALRAIKNNVKVLPTISKTSSETEIRTEESAEYFKKSEVLEMLGKINKAVEDGEGYQLKEWIDYVEELPTYPQATITQNLIDEVTDYIFEYTNNEFVTDDEYEMIKYIAHRVSYILSEKAEQTTEEPIKHFGAIECPNCGRLLMLEEQTYGWCKGCKEYDTEKHCCHRYSSFIRESLQDSINAVLEDIKAEIDKFPRIKAGNSNSPTVKYCIDERLLYEILEKMKGE